MQSDANVICAYGLLGNEGPLFEWLDASLERKLIVLQDKPRFNSLKHPRVRLFFLSEEKKEDVFKQIAWEYLFLKFDYWSDPQESARAEVIFAALKKIQAEVHLVASDAGDPQLRATKNVLANLTHLKRAFSGKELFGKFQAIPAIVCGSGPSLSKNGNELKGLQEQALLFAGGSALPLAAELGVEIHFSAAIDPQPPADRFLAHTYFETPFFYKARVDKQLLEQVQASLLFLPDGNTFIGEEEAFDGGWNVATFLIALATSLGCNPIIFVGLDLAADHQGKIYASGITPTAQEKKLIQIEDEKGVVFHSKSDWLAARKWLEAFVKAHPETLFINATEGGLGIPGVVNQPLKEVKELYCNQSADLQGMIAAALQSLEPMGLSEEMRKKAVFLFDSLKKVYELCAAFLQRAETVFPKPLLDDGYCALALFEIEEEEAYKAILQPFWEIWQRLFLRELQGSIYLHKILFLKKTVEGFDGSL